MRSLQQKWLLCESDIAHKHQLVYMLYIGELSLFKYFRSLIGIYSLFQTAERKSSGRKSYSGQFFLQQDLVSGQIDTPNQDSGVGIEQGKQTAYLVMSEYQTVPVPEESQGAETREQVYFLIQNRLATLPFQLKYVKRNIRESKQN